MHNFQTEHKQRQRETLSTVKAIYSSTFTFPTWQIAVLQSPLIEICPGLTNVKRWRLKLPGSMKIRQRKAAERSYLGRHEENPRRMKKRWTHARGWGGWGVDERGGVTGEALFSHWWRRISRIIFIPFLGVFTRFLYQFLFVQLLLLPWLMARRLSGV